MLAHRRLLLAAVLLAAPTPAVAREEPLDFSVVRTPRDCDAMVRKHTGAFSALYCYRLAARREGSWDEMARHLDGRLSLEHGDHGLRVALALVEDDLGHERAVSLLQEAVRGYSSQSDTGAESRARAELSRLLLRLGQFSRAASELDVAEELVGTLGSDPLRLVVLHARAIYLHTIGEEARAIALQKEVEAAIFPDGPPYLQGQVLEALGTQSFGTGEMLAARDYYERASDCYQRMGDSYAEASSRYGLTLVASHMRALDQISEEEDQRIRKEAIAAARRGGNQAIALHYEMSAVLASPAQIPDKLAAARRLIDQMSLLGGLQFSLQDKRALARMLSQGGNEHIPEALRLLEEANATARDAGMIAEHARGLLSVSWVYKGLEEREKAIAAWLQALDQIERLRDLQSDAMVRARLFSQWAFTYYRLISYLLQGDSGQADTEDIARALMVAERLRARTLLDTLDGSSPRAKAEPTTPTEEERERVLSRIVQIQRQLLAPAINARDRRAAAAELSRLESEEFRLREALAREDPTFGRLRDPRIPDLAAIQASLAPDQAILSYQLTLETNQSSWGILVTRDRASTFPLPPRQRLEESVAVMLGLLERRDGSESVGLRRLSAELLEEPMANAPPGIRSLVVVPDGPLSQLPFELLSETEREITRVPSLTAWTRWKAGNRSVARGEDLLVLADPELPAQETVSDRDRAATLATGLRLGRLPSARLEADALLRAFSGAGTVLAGSGASERALKSQDLHRFRVLHFATHAVVDPEHPERSAVLLAPGGEDEDGLLQPREVAALDLDGALVILTSCSSAAGPDIWGEGMLSLSRSFFQAGAAAIVGSLWPLRDEETGRMMTSLAGHLGEGLSVGAAMAAARADMKAAGAPAQAWAGLILLGDGSFVPLPGGRRDATSITGWLLAGLLSAILMIWLLWRRNAARRI